MWTTMRDGVERAAVAPHRRLGLGRADLRAGRRGDAAGSLRGGHLLPDVELRLGRLNILVQGRGLDHAHVRLEFVIREGESQ